MTDQAGIHRHEHFPILRLDDIDVGILQRIRADSVEDNLQSSAFLFLKDCLQELEDRGLQDQAHYIRTLDYNTVGWLIRLWSYSLGFKSR